MTKITARNLKAFELAKIGCFGTQTLQKAFYETKWLTNRYKMNIIKQNIKNCDEWDKIRGFLFSSEVGMVQATKKALLLPPRSSSIEIEPD
jgi:aspartate/glutamate racemase